MTRRIPRVRHAHPAIVNNPPLSFFLLWRIFLLASHILLGVLIAAVVGMFLVKNVSWHAPIIRWWLRRLCATLNMDVHLHGQPSNDPRALWISNHVSWMDIPVLGGVRSLNFLSKAEVAQWPLIGALASAAGTLFIQRGSGDADRVKDQIVEEINANRRVLFFPEGTTTDGFAVNRFFAKLFSAGVETDCLIQPMVICYHHESGLHPFAPFIGNDEFVPHLLNMLSGDRIAVEVSFLPAEKPQGRDNHELAKHFESIMGSALKSLHGCSMPPNREGADSVQAIQD